VISCARFNPLKKARHALPGLYFFWIVYRSQQELLHLQVTAIFFVTFLMVIEKPPFLNAWLD
jgi:hypothetical protein